MAELTGNQQVQSEVLEGLATAVNHRRWFVELALPYLGDNPIEIGSGLGDYALEWAPRLSRFTATEADPERLIALKERLAVEPKIEVREMLLPHAERGDYSAAVSYNVLEHIEDDKKAMSELYRVMRPGGRGIFQVPQDLNREYTYEDFSITDPKERAGAFGQYDHVRVYGRDYFTRLRNAGFRVEEVDYSKAISREDFDRYRLAPGEILPVCYKE